jgi:hypothetical protein
MSHDQLPKPSNELPDRPYEDYDGDGVRKNLAVELTTRDSDGQVVRDASDNPLTTLERGWMGTGTLVVGGIEMTRVNRVPSETDDFNIGEIYVDVPTEALNALQESLRQPRPVVARDVGGAAYELVQYESPQDTLSPAEGGRADGRRASRAQLHVELQARDAARAALDARTPRDSAGVITGMPDFPDSKN